MITIDRRDHVRYTEGDTPVTAEQYWALLRGQAVEVGGKTLTIDDGPFYVPFEEIAERGGPGSGHHGHEGRPGQVGGSKPSKRTFNFERITVDENGKIDGVSPEQYIRSLKMQHLNDRDNGNVYFQYATILPDWMLEEDEPRTVAIFHDKNEAMEYEAEYLRHLDYEAMSFFSDFGLVMDLSQQNRHHVFWSHQDVMAFRELRRRPENSNMVLMHNHPVDFVDVPPSFSDFNLAYNEGLEEWWVVGPDGRYVVTRGENFDDMPNPYTLKDVHQSWINELYEVYLPDLPEFEFRDILADTPELGIQYVAMQLEMIEEMYEKPGYWNMEHVPNE